MHARSRGRQHTLPNADHAVAGCVQDAGLEELAPADKNGIAYSRDAAGVLKIVYLGGTDKGGEWLCRPSELLLRTAESSWHQLQANCTFST